MDLKLPIPKNWQDFESICLKLWSEIWNDPNAQKNGRQGQSQAGVDVFGKPIYQKNYHGIQCKDKDGRLGSALTKNELMMECNKATNFSPSLANYTIATTSPRDESIQKYYRKLNNNSSFNFDVNVWSWDDIESEIAYRPMILNHFYPSFDIQQNDNGKIKLNRYSTKDHLNAFFSRPQLADAIPNSLKNSLLTLVYELSDNAYKYGKGKLFELEIKNNSVIISDDGNTFNPIIDLDISKTSSKSHVGSFVFETFLKEFEGKIEASYKREGDKNVILFDFDKSIFDFNNDTHFEMSIDLFLVFGREATRGLVSKIPNDKKDIIINIQNIGALSSLIQLVNEALNILNENQTLTLSLPRSIYLGNIHNWFNDERLKIIVR